MDAAVERGASEAITKGYSAPIWMTFRQALELSAHVRKGESGSTVVYASTQSTNTLIP